MINATLHLVNREFAQLAEDFMGLGLLPPDSDVQRLAPALTAVFSKALAGGVSNVSFSALSADLGQTMYQFNFRIPPYYTLLVRSLSVLEVRPPFPLLAPPSLLHPPSPLFLLFLEERNWGCGRG